FAAALSSNCVVPMRVWFRCPHSTCSHLHPFPTRRSSDLLCYNVVQIKEEYHAGMFTGVGVAGDAGRSGSVRRRAHQPNISRPGRDRKSTRLNSSHVSSSYAVFCLKNKIKSMLVALPAMTL